MVAGVVEQHSSSPPKKPGLAAAGQHETVVIPAPKPPEKKGSMFGLPNETLKADSSSQLERPEIALRTSPSLSMLQDRAGTQQGSFVMSSGAQEETSSQASILQQGRIPSSMSPSPMKPPSLQKDSSLRQSLSPVKINREATKALQESIASLLGKRPSPDVEEVTIDAGTTGPTKGSRPVKRVRPQRSKVVLSTPLPEPVFTGYFQVRQVNEPPKVQTRSSAAAAAAALRLDEEMSHVDPLNPFGSYPHEVLVPDSGPPESQQEGIRVVYEDPGQRDEKKRLMNILKGRSGQSGESLDMLTRRSQRIPGF